jgi:prepilin-type N-terminal cleavage/methylation domain-containing protein
MKTAILLLRIRDMRNVQGFTLLEILVALALLSITLAGFIQLFSGSLRSIAKSEDYVYAALKAESMRREVMEKNDLEEDSWTETTDDNYTMNVTVSRVEDERFEELLEMEEIYFLQIDMTLSWMVGEKERSIKLNSLKLLKNEEF